MRRALLAAALALAAGSARAQTLPGGWPMFNQSPQHTSSGTAATSPTFQLAWKTNLGLNNNSHPNTGVSLDASGKLYVAGPLAISALNAASGAIVWTSTIPGTYFSQPAVYGGAVYTSTNTGFLTGNVISLSAVDGSEIFVATIANQSAYSPADLSRFPIGEFNGYGNPTVDPLNGFILAADDDVTAVNNVRRGGFVCLTSTGGYRWGTIAEAGGGGGSIHEGALSPNGATVYMKSELPGRPIYAVDIATGGIVWTLNTNTAIAGNDIGISVRPDGKIYAFTGAGGINDKLSLIDPVAGTIIWSSTFTIPQTELFHAPAVDGNNRVYFIAHQGTDNLYGFDGATGQLLTSQYIYQQPAGGPPTVAAPNSILTIESDGINNWYLVNVDPTTSTLVWKVLLGNSSAIGPLDSPQVTLANGAIYIHSNTTSLGAQDFVEAFTPVPYTTLSISSQAATMSGNVRVTTVTVHVDNAGVPVANVPIVAPFLASDCVTNDAAASCSPGGAINYTDLSGNATYQLLWNFSSISLNHYQALATTITAQVPGLAALQVALQDLGASTFTLTVSTPAIEDNGTTIVRVATVTLTVKNSVGGTVPNWPVWLTISHDPSGGGGTSISPAGYSLTNAVGQSTYTVRFSVQNNYSFTAMLTPAEFSTFAAQYTGGALSMAPVTVTDLDTRPASFTVSFSTPVLQSDLRTSTMTITVKDGGGAPVPFALVAISSWTTDFMTGPLVATFKNYQSFGFDVGAMETRNLVQLPAYTDASGHATILITANDGGAKGFDEYSDFVTSIAVVALDLNVSTPTLQVESDFLAGYSVTAPTSSFVGEPFVSTITAVNSHGHALPLYNEPGVTLTPLFSGTNVQGSGALGTGVISYAASLGQVVISSQTYNKIENIQIKATRPSGNIMTGLSNTLVMLGPVRYVVSVPTSAPAGQVFSATITAVDNGNNPVVGYGATLSVTPVVALATSTPASGSLTPATINLPANGTVVVNNLSYSKGDSIQIKVNDSALAISGFSSSMTITQPALTIDHYQFTASTSVTVGSPFNFQIEAMDASSAPVTYSLNRTLNIQALLAGTNIAGSGSLGVTTLPLAAGATYTFTASQTYNKIETVQLKVTDDDGRVGLSSYSFTFTGPTQFVVAVPTAAQAGVPFQFVVQAQDAGNNQVLGYNGTVNVSAVDATTTTLAGGGILGVTSLNLSGGTGSSSFQSYTKAQGIRFRVTDSGVGVTSVSSSMTVVAGPVASLTLGANPQSTIATVPSVLTALAVDAFNNPILGSTVTFTVQSGSAVVTLGLVNGAVSGAAGVVSTQAPTNVAGSAVAFFSSTTTLFSQADVVSAHLGALTTATTIYNAVLVTGAGGVVANQGNPQLAVTIPPSAWGFNVRMSVSAKTELSASDLALTTAAFAASANTFVSTTVMHVDVVRDASPGTLAGAGGRLITVGLPYALTTGSVTVGGYHGQSILVPLSVLRVFKLNKQTSIFEMVLDGTNLPQGNGTIAAQVADPEGIFALGVPPFATLGGASSGTVTTALASGALAKVSVPFGAFATPTTLTVSPLSAPSIPGLPGGLNLTSIGVAVSINTNGIQPAAPVTVSIGYTAGQVAGVNANQLKLARYDVGVGWKVLDSQVDTAGNTVTAQTSNFSLFAIVAAAPSTSVSSGIVFPNPFRPSLGHLNIKFMSLPAAAHIRVFTVSGRLLKELDADAAGSVLSWNGTDKDGRALPSGVYLAVVTDTAGGSGKATIKFAVQR